MTGQTRKAIDTLGRELRDYCWGLYSGSIRCVAIEDTDNHSELGRLGTSESIHTCVGRAHFFGWFGACGQVLSCVRPH